MNGECVIKWMYRLIKLCSRCMIFVLYLNIYAATNNQQSTNFLQAILFVGLCMTGVLSGAEYVSVTSGVWTVYPSRAPEFPPVFIVVRVTRSLVLCVCFVDRCLTFWSIFLSLCCLFLFDVRIMITPSYEYI